MHVERVVAFAAALLQRETFALDPESVRAVELYRAASGATRFPLLIALLRYKEPGRRIARVAVEAMAVVAQREVAEVTAIAKFVDAITDPGVDDRPLHLCVSISCSGRRAIELHRALLPECDRLGMRLLPTPVHCLSQCEFGPSIAFGDRVYVGNDERIVVDERPWRTQPFTAAYE